MEVVELKVRLHCKACEKTVRKALCNLKGVRCVQIDRGSSSSPSSSSIASKITVMGYMERKEVVRAVLKTGRKVQLLLPPPAAMAPMMSITDDRIMEAASPKLPRGGFRCIIPQCARFYSNKLKFSPDHLAKPALISCHKPVGPNNSSC